MGGLTFAVILVASAVIAWQARKSNASGAAYPATLAVAVFMLIAFTGVYTNRFAAVPKILPRRSHV